MERDPDSVRLEADYWRELLAMAGQLSRELSGAAGQLGPPVLAVIDRSVAVTVSRVADPQAGAELETLERVLAGIGETMSHLERAQALVLEVARLGHGRAIALRLETLGEEAEPGTAGEEA